MTVFFTLTEAEVGLVNVVVVVVVVVLLCLDSHGGARHRELFLRHAVGGGVADPIARQGEGRRAMNVQARARAFSGRFFVSGGHWCV